MATKRHSAAFGRNPKELTAEIAEDAENNNREPLASSGAFRAGPGGVTRTSPLNQGDCLALQSGRLKRCTV